MFMPLRAAGCRPAKPQSLAKPGRKSSVGRATSGAFFSGPPVPPERGIHPAGPTCGPNTLEPLPGWLSDSSRLLRSTLLRLLPWSPGDKFAPEPPAIVCAPGADLGWRQNTRDL